ncbi:hypothetical protein MHYP_G00017170 [Metynnis hypsauchen]
MKEGITRTTKTPTLTHILTAARRQIRLLSISITDLCPQGFYRTHLYYCSALRSLPLMDPQRYCTEPVCPSVVTMVSFSTLSTEAGLILIAWVQNRTTL